MHLVLRHTHVRKTEIYAWCASRSVKAISTSIRMYFRTKAKTKAIVLNPTLNLVEQKKSSELYQLYRRF